jgi:hypothetical protein
MLTVRGMRLRASACNPLILTLSREGRGDDSSHFKGEARRGMVFDGYTAPNTIPTPALPLKGRVN